MEGTAEPTLCVVFSPRQADDVRHALCIVERFVALNCELFQLVEAIKSGRNGMQVHVSIGENHRFELREALLVYRDRQSSFITRTM